MLPRLRALLFLLAVAPGALLPSCASPADFMVHGERRIDLEAYPAGTCPVEIAGPTGGKLRGIFLRGADPQAPLVLHFNAMGTSCAEPAQSEARSLVPALARNFAGLGFSVLVIDYAGVGASDGEPDPDAVRADARCILAHALEEVDGRAERIVLRGASLGALAAAGLLDDGARPSLTVLVAPVRSETAVRHFVEGAYGGLVAFLAGPFIPELVDVDLLAVLRRKEPEIHVVRPQSDIFVDDDDAGLLEAAAREGGHAVELSAFGFEGGDDGQKMLSHVFAAAFDGTRPTEGECTRLRELFGLEVPEGTIDAALALLPPDRRALRTDAEWRPILLRIAGRFRRSPRLIAALAARGHGDGDLSLLATWLHGFDDGHLDSLSDEALLDLVDLEDIDGRLPIRPIAWVSGFWHAVRRQVAGAELEPWDPFLDVESEVPGLDWIRFGSRLLGQVVQKEPGRPLESPREWRRYLRLALKSAGIPDRLGAGGRLEAFEGGEWHVLSVPGLDPAADPASASPGREGSPQNRSTVLTSLVDPSQCCEDRASLVAPGDAPACPRTIPTSRCCSTSRTSSWPSRRSRATSRTGCSWPP